MFSIALRTLARSKSKLVNGFCKKSLGSNVVLYSHVPPSNPAKRRTKKGHTRIRPWGRDCHVQRPDLPADLLLPLSSQSTEPQPCAPAPLLKKLNGDAATYAAAATVGISGRQVLADKGRDAGVDEGLELDVIDGREREVENVDGAGANRGEVAVEEDQVQDT